MTLSILIPTLDERKAKLNILLQTLAGQIGARKDVQVVYISDNRQMTTGAKRNKLLNQAKGEYVAFFDDDDLPTAVYIESVMAALKIKPDCVGFKGWYEAGRKRFEWYISNALPYVDATINRQLVYLRHTNHLAPIRREIALQIGYKDQTLQEDWDYAVRLRESGLIQTETFINKHLYRYIK